MTFIPGFAASAPVMSRNTSDLLTLKNQIETLTRQLTTGRAAETYAELGSRRSESLSTRAMLSAIDGYDATIVTVRPRVELASASLTQIANLTTTLRKGLTTNRSDSDANRALARASLENIVDALNQQAGGHYLFAGRASSTPPVLPASVLLDGDATDPARPLAGLRTLVNEQIRADRGTGLGRLTLSPPTSTSIAVGEDADAGARANFGFTIAEAPTASSAFAAISYSPSPLQGATPSFAKIPSANDHFRVVVNRVGGGQKIYDLTGADLADVSSVTNAASSLTALIGSDKIASVQSATPPGLTASFANSTAPTSFTINVASQPKSGDQISIKLAMRDGTTTTLALRAQVTADPASTADFTIGATATATAQNLSDALRRALSVAAETTLAASSTVRAAQDFFAGSTAVGLAPRRIDFSGSAPAYAQTPSASTVIWYRGEASATDPRGSFAVRTGATSTVLMGARANEPEVRNILSGFAAIAISDGGTSAKPSADHWKALAERTTSLLPQTTALEAISTDFSLAASSLSEAQARNRSARGILQSELDGIESVSPQDIVAKLLDLQNRLQASYQVTAMLSKLSLVNFLR
ncbi:hypothetical protein [Bradyrhizobium paxllaeri]|uniref:flagellin N-terminal helical domain-containing protein n=1 Tax=Bradyrhizobium paxllaeri TaxID=190148 RepID=UPI0008103513|nr:hypothetical protein [Bradyrhizobium paxllaeri]